MNYLNELKSNETSFTSEHLLEIAWGLQQLSVCVTRLEPSNEIFALSSVCSSFFMMIVNYLMAISIFIPCLSIVKPVIGN